MTRSHGLKGLHDFILSQIDSLDLRAVVAQLPERLETVLVLLVRRLAHQVTAGALCVGGIAWPYQIFGCRYLGADVLEHDRLEVVIIHTENLRALHLFLERFDLNMLYAVRTLLRSLTASQLRYRWLDRRF